MRKPEVRTLGRQVRGPFNTFHFYRHHLTVKEENDHIHILITTSH